jgi:hypothetical protein
MNKTIHGLITACFAFACWCLWGMLTLISRITLRVPDYPPGFTELWLRLRPLFVVLPVVAAAYCVYVWIRKTDSRRSWVPFFAAAVGSLVLVMLPTMIAIWLPVIQFIELTGKK